MKRVLQIFAAVVVVLIVGVIILTISIDPNDYKPEIESKASKTLNRELTVAGDLGWSFFPTLGIDIGSIAVKNPAGYQREHLLEVKKATVAVELLPLFTGDIKLGMIQLDGFHFVLINNPDGHNNLEGIGSGKKAKQEKKPDPQEQVALPDLTLSGILITNAMIEIDDVAKGEVTSLTLEKLQLGGLVPGEETDLEMLALVSTGDIKGNLSLKSRFKLDTKQNRIEMKDLQLKSELDGSSLPVSPLAVAMNTHLSYQLDEQQLNLKDLSLLLDKLSLKGTLAVKNGEVPKVKFDLSGDDWDLSPWIPESEQVKAEAEQQPPMAEPDLGFLRLFEVDGKLAIKTVHAMGLLLSDLFLDLKIDDGRLEFQPFKMNLYDGTMQLKGVLDEAAGRNRFKINSNLNGVAIRPLLMDMAEIDFISGAAEMSADISGQGLTIDKLKSNSKGQGNFTFSDGSLYGINIPKKIRNAKALLKGEPVEETTADEKTDFSSIKGDFSIGNGIVTNTALQVLAPLFRADGKGTAQLLEERLDYKLKVAMTGSLKGQTEESEGGLLEVPLTIKGPWSSPKFGLDADSALKAELEKKKQELKDKAKQKLKDKFKGIF